jgi:hypothetical protein
MNTIPPFFEAVFTKSGSTQSVLWCNESTRDYHIFTSAFGVVRFRKRQSYPATFAICKGELLCFGYGNLQRGKTIADSSLAAVTDDDFGIEEFLYCEVNCRQESVTVQRDTACILPIFAATRANILALSNHSEYLYDMLDAKRISLNMHAVLNYMLFDDRHRSLLDGCKPLNDRVRLEWRGGAYAIHQPADGRIANIMHQPEGDPRYFKQALESTLDTYWQRYDNVAFQLSGGLDSAIAPGYYADQGQQVLTVTLGLPKTMGDRQRRKLSEIQQRFNINQYVVALDPSKHFPFANIVSTGQQGFISEFDDLHLVATRQLADHLTERGIATVFTGVGGDELCQNIDPASVLPTSQTVREQRLQTQSPNYTTEAFAALRQTVQSQPSSMQDMPVPAIAYSVMLTHLGINNTFVDRNIWPVAPLADPALFLFTQSIPAWYRYNKNLLRMYQFARAYPESIIHPKTVEDFSEFIHECKPILKQLCATYLANSRLEAQGLISKPRLQRYIRDIFAAPFDSSDTRILEVIRLIAIEHNLQNF